MLYGLGNYTYNDVCGETQDERLCSAFCRQYGLGHLYPTLCSVLLTPRGLLGNNDF